MVDRSNLSSIGWTGIVLLTMLSGCAVIGKGRAPDAPPPVVPPVVGEAPAKSDVSAPSAVRRVQTLLHAAFAAIDIGQMSRAQDSLAIATNILIASYRAPSADDSVAVLSHAEAIDLTSAAIDLYYDALAGPDPIKPEHPLARLIDVLPRHYRTAQEVNNRYRNLYTKVLAGTSPVRIDVNERVLEKIAFFQKNNQRIFRTWMRRMGTYGPLIQQTLREENLPEDLIFLSMIESGFNTKAYSRARAVGMWQFVSHTGRLYGLRRDTWVDERRDPEKATRAAARHLRHLYNLFGDWQLVITGYNCGQGRLQRSMRADGTQNFWEMDSLPKESRHHLPKFMAVLLMARDPSFFGVELLEYDDPLAFDIVQVNHPVDLRLGARCAGTTYETMRALNPELRVGYSPPMPVHKTYGLRVPHGSSDRFLAQYAKVPEDKKVQIIDYRVRSGDTISNIALTFGVRSSAVMDANGIRNPRRLRAGQKLKIPVTPRQSKHSRALATSSSTTRTSGSGDKIVYRVKRGDTLWDIARSEGVTPDQICAWNVLRATGHIHPGDELTIWRTPGRSADRSSAPLVEAATHHRVHRGDTLWEIARRYNTSIRELKRLNEIQNASQIKAGDRLLVRKSSAAVE